MSITIPRALEAFEPVSLEEMDQVKLMDRSDTKYTFQESLLPGLMAELKDHYRVLEVSGHRQIHYESVYFDTANLDLFHQHQCGKLNRFKIRYRRYVESELSFFEIKYKNNKGRTVKRRIREDQNHMEIAGRADEFLRAETPLRGDQLHAELQVGFVRTTLVGRQTPERVTLDTGIVFSNSRRHEMKNLVIAEAKQERARRSEFVELMRRHHIRQGSLSKYCLGIASLHPGIRQNNFKPGINLIHKLIYDVAARAAG